MCHTTVRQCHHSTRFSLSAKVPHHSRCLSTIPSPRVDVCDAKPKQAALKCLPTTTTSNLPASFFLDRYPPAHVRLRDSQSCKGCSRRAVGRVKTGCVSSVRGLAPTNSHVTLASISAAHPPQTAAGGAGGTCWSGSTSELFAALHWPGPWQLQPVQVLFVLAIPRCCDSSCPSTIPNATSREPEFPSPAHGVVEAFEIARISPVHATCLPQFGGWQASPPNECSVLYFVCTVCTVRGLPGTFRSAKPVLQMNHGVDPGVAFFGNAP